jgi:hypothetical protein
MFASARTARRAARFAPVALTLLGLGACTQVPQQVVLDGTTLTQVAPDEPIPANGGESDDVVATPLPSSEPVVISRPIYVTRPIYVPRPIYVVPTPVYPAPRPDYPSPPPVVARPVVPAPPYTGGNGNWIPVTN